MEVAAGKVKSKPVMLENGMADVVQWTLATAAANKLNVLRAFAHGVDGSFPLQISAGQHMYPVVYCLIVSQTLHWLWSFQHLCKILLTTTVSCNNDIHAEPTCLLSIFPPSNLCTCIRNESGLECLCSVAQVSTVSTPFKLWTTS